MSTEGLEQREWSPCCAMVNGNEVTIVIAWGSPWPMGPLFIREETGDGRGLNQQKADKCWRAASIKRCKFKTKYTHALSWNLSARNNSLMGKERTPVPTPPLLIQLVSYFQSIWSLKSSQIRRLWPISIRSYATSCIRPKFPRSKAKKRPLKMIGISEAKCGSFVGSAVEGFHCGGR